jgi:nucleotide-binding universal stress UspA family protein
MRKNRVLIPVDGSAFSLQVIPYITRFLSPEQVELVLFEVAAMPEAVAVGTTVYVYADQEAASLEAECQVNLLPTVHQLEALGYTVSSVVRFGEATTEIERYLAHEPVDLVAMTTHGRTGLARVLMGSVAQYVINHCNLPVLLYRPQEQEAAFAAPAEIVRELERV